MLLESVSMVAKKFSSDIGPSMAGQGRFPPEEKKQAEGGRRPLGLSQLAKVVANDKTEAMGFVMSN